LVARRAQEGEVAAAVGAENLPGIEPGIAARVSAVTIMRGSIGFGRSNSRAR